ncbi:hypothetical protein CBL_04457 [Carabus blaptoides fortunei]
MAKLMICALVVCLATSTADMAVVDMAVDSVADTAVDSVADMAVVVTEVDTLAAADTVAIITKLDCC